MRRARAGLAVVLIGLALPAAAGAPPVPPHPRTFVLGLDFIPNPDPRAQAIGDEDPVSTLVEIDPSTGHRLRRPLRLADVTDDDALISPDRRVIAFGSSYSGRVIRVDPVGWRRQAPVQAGEPWDQDTGAGDRVDLLSWPGLLIATTGPWEGKEPRERTLRVIDPVSGRVTASEPLGGFELGSWLAPDGGVVVLSAPVGDIGAARLTAVGPAGTIRTVTLDRIPGGWAPGPSTYDGPGLAVDAAARRAFVVARGVAAEIDLQTLSVGYHSLPTGGAASAGPAHETGTSNPSAGFRRSASWLGDGRIAVSGADTRIVGDKQADRPAGLRFIDTATWTTRLAAPGVSDFSVAAGTVLASTIAWDADRHAWAGYGLVAFAPDGRPLYRRRAFRGHKSGEGPGWGSDARHWYWHSRTYPERVHALRDPRTGKLVRRVRNFSFKYEGEPFTWTPPANVAASARGNARPANGGR